MKKLNMKDMNEVKGGAEPVIILLLLGGADSCEGDTGGGPLGD